MINQNDINYMLFRAVVENWCNKEQMDYDLHSGKLDKITDKAIALYSFSNNLLNKLMDMTSYDSDSPSSLLADITKSEDYASSFLYVIRYCSKEVKYKIAAEYQAELVNKLNVLERKPKYLKECVNKLGVITGASY